MKKKQLVKSEKSTDNVVKTLYSSFTGHNPNCTINWDTGEETDILL